VTSLLSFGLFLSLVLVVDMTLGDAPYVVLVSMACMLGIVQVWLHGQGQRTVISLARAYPGLGPLDRAVCKALLWCWVPIVGSWILGALTGLVHGVTPANVFRNFFGLLCYLLIPLVLAVGPRPQALMTTVIAAGFIQAFIALYLTAVTPPDPSLLLGAGSISDLRTIYSTGFITMFPVLTTGLAVRWFPQLRAAGSRPAGLPRVAANWLVVALITLALLIPAMSKGFIFATGLLILAMLLVSAHYALRFGGTWRPVLWSAALVVVVFALLPPEIRSLIGYSFSGEEGGNAIRSEQFDYLASEFTWFGNGLGATLRSGYTRDDTGYGFELTYLNVIHKLGVWSVFLFGAYLLTMLLAISRLWRGVQVLPAAFAVGSMGFLVVGAANPLLLSPTAVTLHCIAIFVLVGPYLSHRRYRASVPEFAGQRRVDGVPRGHGITG
jgi:hypothetical protein